MVDNNVGGMLVVEYYDRSNLSSRREEPTVLLENDRQLILGDTKKKTLYEERLYNRVFR